MMLEEYIRKNRTEFDQLEYVDRQAIWENVQHHTQPAKRRKVLSRVAAAASTLLILTALLVSIHLDRNVSPPELATPLIELEDQFGRLAGDRQNAIDISSLDEQVYAEFIIELQQLDSMYFDLKTDISNTPEIERIIELAIKFHERKLSILELLEKEIENQKRTQTYEADILL